MKLASDVKVWKLISFIGLSIFLFGLTTSGNAQDGKINVNALIEETQMMSEGTDDMTMVWWIPEEFWQASFDQDPSISAAEAEEFINVLRPYTLVIAVDGTIGTFGGVTYKSESYLRANISIIDNQGISYSPLSTSVVNADATNFLSMMKPVFSNMLGPMGENMHFIVFSGKNKSGNPLADPHKEGSITISLEDEKFKYRLPLGSLLPPKKCSIDGEKMNGAWKYCPFHGVELKK
jgi:hypothetical protein